MKVDPDAPEATCANEVPDFIAATETRSLNRHSRLPAPYYLQEAVSYYPQEAYTQ